MPSSEAMARVVARRITDGMVIKETPRQIADAVLAMIGATRTGEADVSVLAPAVAAIVGAAEQAARVEILQRAADELRHEAVKRFDDHGTDDERGAAVWDAAAHINPDDFDALNVTGKRDV